MAKKKESKDWTQLAIAMILLSIGISILLWNTMDKPIALLLIFSIWVGIVVYIISNIFD